MKNIIKLFIFIFAVILIFNFSSNSILAPNENESTSKNVQVKKTKEVNTDKFTFNNEILLIEVKEQNNNLTVDNVSGGITSQPAYIKGDKDIHFFYDSELPSKKTKLIIARSAFASFDYLIDYDLYFNNTDYQGKATINKVDNENVDNSKRDFLNSTISTKHLNSGEIKVSINDKTFTLNPNESKVINGDNNSSLMIKNHGFINSSENMSFDKLK